MYTEEVTTRALELLEEIAHDLIAAVKEDVAEKNAGALSRRRKEFVAIARRLGFSADRFVHQVRLGVIR